MCMRIVVAVLLLELNRLPTASQYLTSNLMVSDHPMRQMTLVSICKSWTAISQSVSTNCVMTRRLAAYYEMLPLRLLELAPDAWHSKIGGATTCTAVMHGNHHRQSPPAGARGEDLQASASLCMKRGASDYQLLIAAGMHSWSSGQQGQVQLSSIDTAAASCQSPFKGAWQCLALLSRRSRL